MLKFTPKTANFFLLGAILLFILTLFLVHEYPGNIYAELLRFMAEAAVVGGAADWFAVTALFKKPLPAFIPQPHTALIPKNRERIIQAVARLVEEELLSVRMIYRLLGETQLSAGILRYLEREKGLLNISYEIALFLARIVGQLDPSATSAQLAINIRSMLRKTNFSPILARIMKEAQKKGIDDNLLGWLLQVGDKAITKESVRQWLLEQLRDAKQEKVSGHFIKSLVAEISERLNAINLEEAALSLQTEILRLCREMQDPQHEMRLRLRSALNDTVVQLGKNRNWWRTIEAWKDELLDQSAMQASLERFLEVILREGLAEKARPQLAQWLTGTIHKYLLDLQENHKALAWLDNYLKEALSGLIMSEHHLIGVMVQETLSEFPDEKLNNFIEEKVGSDLQGIRVNGVIVGSLIGLLLFLALNFVCAPLLALL